MKITLKQFELFKKEALKWLDYFGMKDWQVHFLFKQLKGTRAQICHTCVDGIATITLNNNWDELDKSMVSNVAIQKTAFHEVCELLLGRLESMVFQRFNLNDGDVEEEMHRIIRVLENTVWENR